MLGWRKDIHHAINRLRCGTGVQGAEHQVTRFSGADRQLDRFQVSQFSYKDHVGVFTQGRSQGIGKTAGVFIELSLMHQALVAFVNEFDRIFDREDVLAAGVIDVIEQRGQGCGFS